MIDMTLVIFIIFFGTPNLYAQQKQEIKVDIQLPEGFSSQLYYTGDEVPASIKYINDSALYVLSQKIPQELLKVSRGSTYTNSDTILFNGPPLVSQKDFLFHPNGKIYITVAGGRNSKQIVYKIAPEDDKWIPFVTGESIGTPNAFNPYDMAIAPPGFDGPNVDPGDIIVADNGLGRQAHMAVWAINPSTGDARAIAKGRVFQDGPLRVEFNPDGKLIISQNNDSGSSRIIMMDKEGESRTLISNITSPGKIAVNPATGDLFFILYSEVLQIWHLPAKGGLPSLFAKVAGNSKIRALEFSADGQNLYVGNNNDIIEIKGPFLESFSGIEYTMGSVKGKVLDSKDNEPYTGITIIARDGNKIVSSSQSDENGEYELLLFPGNYRVNPMIGQGINSSEEMNLTLKVGQEIKADFTVSMIELPLIIEQSMAQYKLIKGYRCTILTDIRMVKSGNDNHMTSEILFACEKPDRILVKQMSESQLGNMEYYGNGEKMIYYNKSYKQYLEEDFEKELIQNISSSLESIIPGDFILAEDPLQNMRSDLIEVKETGTEQVEGISTILINMKKSNITRRGVIPRYMPSAEVLIPIQMWIGSNDKLIRKIVYTLDMEQLLTNLPDDQRSRMEEYYKGMKITFTETHKGIEIDPIFTTDDFRFIPPKGTELVKSFSPPAPVRPENSDLMNSPAPGFSLKDTDGKTTNLEDLKGKVVLLDFWATWCGPCIQAMPHIQALSDIYNEEDVIILGINTWERDKNKVEPFLKEKKISYRILLDSDNEVVNEYGVSGIPTFFIIDKKGTIRYTYTGFPADEKIIQQNIDELLIE